MRYLGARNGDVIGHVRHNLSWIVLEQMGYNLCSKRDIQDRTKDNLGYPRCPELQLALFGHMMAIPDSLQFYDMYILISFQ